MLKRTHYIVTVLTILTFLLAPNNINAQRLLDEFKPMDDSLAVLLKERSTVTSVAGLKNVMKRGRNLDFYFTSDLSDYPWHKEDIQWLRQELKSQLPETCRNYNIGRIFSNRVPIEDYVTAHLGFNGEPTAKKNISDPRRKNPPTIVRRLNGMKFDKGLTGRNIALWQSHGRYYNEDNRRWQWQRAPVLRTVEDMYTQSYVLEFLIPMLENAGAYVMTPRERDIQAYESVVDNDPCFETERTGMLRKSGVYKETGVWEDAGKGFADLKEFYSGTDNPFTMGTARKAQTVSSKSKKKAEIKWTPEIPERGEYAVYVSYKTLPNSSESAAYTVRHAGGKTSFAVNQKMGGGTWIYLGTFEFNKGDSGYVSLSNVTPGKRKSSDRKTVVTADGVRFGGGMGKIARGEKEDSCISGMPAFCEGAIYSMQWAGCDSTLYKEHDNEYTNDFATRGPWVNLMSGGSRVNPNFKLKTKGQEYIKGKGIPFDLCFAFHSDAGTTPNDSIVGTLGIYTLKKEGSRKLGTGEDRMTSRTLTDFVQSQLVRDIRSQFEPEWSRRYLWNRSYSESRTPEIPSMLLEFLSHQNFADMKYGLDPSFRFAASRSIYKGILKYLSNRYGCNYIVQPLPVKAISAEFVDGIKADRNNVMEAKLSWREIRDTLEATADPTGYIIYTKVNDGAFDNGRIIQNYTRTKGRAEVKVKIDRGNIYSYKIVAYNDGGKSFPSEIVSIGSPKNPVSQSPVMIVNNFTRISSPTWFDTPEYAGFDDYLDSGVPYKYGINYIGSMYMFRRNFPWIDDDCPGFGASYNNFAGKVIAGNTFDYAYTHGKSIMKAGYAFYSTSRDAFMQNPNIGDYSSTMDLICGKQVTVKMGRGAKPNRYSVFPVKLQEAIEYYTEKEKNIILSGAHIGTDVWDQVYPVSIDSTYRENTKKFVQTVLGYKWRTNYASKTAKVIPLSNNMLNFDSDFSISYENKLNKNIYSVETVDGILPFNNNSEIFLRYSDSLIPAGVCYKGNGYKVVSLGFPIETIKNINERDVLFQDILDFFHK